MIKFIFIAYSFLEAAYTYLTEFTRDFLRSVGCHCFLKISAYACNQANGSTGIDHADSAMLRLRVASTAHQPRRQRAYGSHEYIVYVREGWTYAPLSHDLFFFFHRHMTSQLILFHISFRFSFVKIHKVRAACFRFVRRIVCSTLFQSSNDNPIERTGSVLASPLPVQYHTLRHDPILNSRLEFK